MGVLNKARYSAKGTVRIFKTGPIRFLVLVVLVLVLVLVIVIVIVIVIWL
jgi:hypothetical protein